jgi:hypothetical protein
LLSDIRGAPLAAADLLVVRGWKSAGFPVAASLRRIGTGLAGLLAMLRIWRSALPCVVLAAACNSNTGIRLVRDASDAERIDTQLAADDAAIPPDSTVSADGATTFDSPAVADATATADLAVSEAGQPDADPYQAWAALCRQRGQANACEGPLCTFGCCGPGGPYAGCSGCCNPRGCEQIAVSDCPAGACQIVTNCAGQQICFPRFGGSPPACGPTTYYGQDVDCCPGLARRCGRAKSDGTCDPTASDSAGLAQCLPCGNGVCDQFETPCNCPEDCTN